MLTERQKDEIVLMREQLVTQCRIAQEMNVSRETVSKVLRERGVGPMKRGKPTVLTDSQKHHAKMCYLSGDTLREIAEDLGVGTTTVYSALRKDRTMMRNRGCKRKMDTIDLELAHRMRRQQKSMREIAEAIGHVTVSTVWRALGRATG